MKVAAGVQTFDYRALCIAPPHFKLNTEISNGTEKTPANRGKLDACDSGMRNKGDFKSDAIGLRSGFAPCAFCSGLDQLLDPGRVQS